MPSDCCYFVDKAAAAAAAPALYYFGSILHCFAVFTQNLGQTRLKCELVHLKQYHTRAAAHADVFAYLEAFYNTVRPHSALGWIPPERFEARLCASVAA